MKILNKLTIKHLKANKKRTVVTIVGIILSTALMVGIGLLFSTLRDNSVKMIEEDSGTHHVIIEMDNNKLDIIAKNQNVDKYIYKSSLGYALYDGIQNKYKPYIHVVSAQDEYLNNLKLIDGRLPNNNSEIIISEHLETNGGIKLNIGDKIVLNVGKRVDKEGNSLGEGRLINYSEYNENTDTYEWIEEEYISKPIKKEYIVVGICKRDVLEEYENPGYSAFTKDEMDHIKVYVTYKNIKDTYKNTSRIATNLGYKGNNENQFEEVIYNTKLLSINGVTTYNNLNTSMGFVISIILSLISIACIIVIYNSFAISVMERKKQFGLFSSIGATKKQLSHTVFFEAFIVGIIGIPLGILSAYVGIGIVLKIINYLLPNVFSFPLSLVTYPLFILIPIIFMIITILISAYLPAKRAAKVSPIEAIRQNDDIKIKSNKVKSPKIVTKIFGIEGSIAYKNMKRNKKKYRITIISLFISIVLFISFSSLIKYGIKSSLDYAELPDYEYEINIATNNKDDLVIADEYISKIKNVDGIKKIVISKGLSINVEGLNYKYSKDINKVDYEESEITNANLISLDENSYSLYKKEIGLNEDRPIILNNFKAMSYKNSERKVVSGKIFDYINDFKISNYNYDTSEYSSLKYDIKNVFLTDISPMGINSNIGSLDIIISEDMLNKISLENDIDIIYNIFINSSNYKEIDELVDKLDTNKYIHANHINILEEMKLMNNMFLVIKILLYGFISLVTLIGVTSVFNTINTSIALRRKEFSVLRSIGLTPHGFNKILFFESLFFGLKSLLYGIPVSLLITILLHLSISNTVEFGKLIIPWNSILLAIIGVFIIILISMWYSTIKIKKENILDAIRDENI